jgi:hypothetical protein
MRASRRTPSDFNLFQKSHFGKRPVDEEGIGLDLDQGEAFVTDFTVADFTDTV